MKPYPLNPFGIENTSGAGDIISVFYQGSDNTIQVSLDGVSYESRDLPSLTGLIVDGITCAGGWFMVWLTTSSSVKSVWVTKDFIEYQTFALNIHAATMHYAKRRYTNPYDNENQYLPVCFANSRSATFPGVFYFLLDKDTGIISRHLMFIGNTQNASYAADNWGQYDEYTGAMFIGFGVTNYYKRMYYNFTPTSNENTPFVQFWTGTGQTNAYWGYRLAGTPATSAITSGIASAAALQAWNGSTQANSTTMSARRNVLYNATAFYGINGVNAILTPASNGGGAIYAHTSIGAPSTSLFASAGTGQSFTNMILAGNNTDTKSEYLFSVSYASRTAQQLRVYDVAADEYRILPNITEGVDSNVTGDIYYNAPLKRLFIFYGFAASPNNGKLAIITLTDFENFTDFTRDATWANNTRAVFCANVGGAAQKKKMTGLRKMDAGLITQPINPMRSQDFGSLSVKETSYEDYGTL